MNYASKYRLVLVAAAAAAFFSDLIAFLMDAKLIPFTVTHAFLLFAIACVPVLTRPPPIEASARPCSFGASPRSW